MKERIKELRRHLGLTQQEFAAKIRIDRSAIANYERGTRAPGNTVIDQICQKYGVSEEWLRTGEGPMLIEQTKEEELTQFFDKVLSDTPGSFRRNLVSALARLDEKHWQMLAEVAEVLKDTPIPDPEPVVLTPEEKAEAAAAEYYQQVLAEEKAAERLSASHGGACGTAETA